MFEKVESKKKVGDLTCEDYCEIKGCYKCPLWLINCDGDSIRNTLREKFEIAFKEYPQLEPLRAYFEKALEREVEE